MIPLHIVEAEACRRDFALFVRLAWSQIDPAQLAWSWHMDALTEHLQAVHNGDIRNLLINIPPGFSKSLMGSVFYPAWVWGNDPTHQFICASYAQELSNRDSVRCRDLISSAWYQDIFPDVRIKSDENQKTFFELTSKGNRRAISVGSKATGFRGDTHVVDDPLNAKEANSEAALFEHVDWHDRVMPSRFNDKRTGKRIVIMQRLHGADLSAHLLERGDWESLILPMEYDPERKCTIEVTGFKDPREEPGELLFPERFPVEEVESLKVELGPDFQGQYNQTPVAASGGEVKRHWIRHWYPKGMNPPPPPVRVRVSDKYVVIPQIAVDVSKLAKGQSWDPSVKKTVRGSYCAGTVWGYQGQDDFLLDLFHERCEFTAQVAGVLEMSRKWPDAHAKLIEDKANGPAIISAIKNEVGGIEAIQTPPGDDKETRFKAVAPYIKGGNVYVPHPDLCEWVGTVLSEVTQFPRAPNDDIIDTISQWLHYRHSSGLADLVRLARM